MFPALRLLLALAIPGAQHATAAPPPIEVEGVSDRAVFNSPPEVRVPEAPGFMDAIALNGRVLTTPAFRVPGAGHYRLRVERSGGDSGETATLDLQFVVLDPERGGAEWGLAPWTPPPVVASPQSALDAIEPEFITPASLPSGLSAPWVLITRDAEGTRAPVNGVVSPDELPPTLLKRGVASGHLPASATEGPDPITVLLGERLLSIPVQRVHSEGWHELGPDHDGSPFPDGALIRVTENVTVPAGEIWTLPEGAFVALAPGVDIRVEGTLRVQGTRERPVTLAPDESGDPWGGFILPAAPARLELTGVLATGSGADRRWFSRNGIAGTHRPEQAFCFLGPGAEGAFRDCFLIDLDGQAMHGSNAVWSFENGVIQRCQTVGQFNGGEVTIRNAALLDFPSDDDSYVDGDNDGIYFTLGTHSISDTLIGWCKDDGIDAGGDAFGVVTVERTWIEACFHEGMALSGADRIVEVQDSVFLNNGQGVESGYLSPRVTVRGGLLSGNLVGARFGDNYHRLHSGRLDLIDTIAVNNERDVWGFAREIWTERISAMSLTDVALSLLHPILGGDRPWDGEADGPRLTPLGATRDTAGAGFAEPRTDWSPDPLVPGPVVVLDRFRDRETRVRFDVLVGEITVDSGDITFPAGFLRGSIPISPEVRSRLRPGRTALVRLLESDDTVPDARLDQLLLNRPQEPANLTIAGPDATWRFGRGGDAPEEAPDTSHPVHPDFDDASFTAGTPPFGYAAEGVATAVPGPSEPGSVLWLRHEFHLDTPERLDRIDLTTRSSAGLVLWINGIRIAAQAPSDGEPPAARVFHLTAPGVLRHGRNLLAVGIADTAPVLASLHVDIEMQGFVPDDSDLDGLPDAWEHRIADAEIDGVLGPADVDGADDFDGDGASNRSELEAGTDPANPHDVLRPVVRWLGPAAIRIVHPTSAGRRYRVLGTDAVSGTAWAEEPGVVQRAGTQPDELFHDVPAGDTPRFLRIEVERIPTTNPPRNRAGAIESG